MDFDQIKILLAIARNKSFSQAAEELCYSRSSVSKQVNALELELGVRIFDRRTKSKVQLTSEGETILPLVKAIDADYDALIQESKRMAKRDRDLSVGCVDGLSYFGEDELILRFASLNGEISISQTSDRQYRLMSLIDGRQLDVVILPLVDCEGFRKNFEGKFAVLPLRKSHLKIAIAKTHPLAQRESLSLLDLKDEKFIFHRSRSQDAVGGDPKMQRFETACANLGFRPNIARLDVKNSMIFAMVAAREGVAPLMNKPKMLRDDIVVLPFEEDYYYFTVSAIYRQDNRSEALAQFISFLRKHSSSSVR